MKQAATQELFAYWNRVRGSRTEPERAELDPGAIRGILANTFILEIDEQLQFPMRIAGTRLGALFVRELKGKAFMDLWAPEARKSVLELLATVLDDRSPAIAGAEAAPDGHPPLELELLLLPLRHYGKTHARMIGSLAPCAIPTWLGLSPSPGLKVNSMRIVRRPDDLAQYIQPLARPNAGHPPRYGHLTVHDGGVSDR
ncbi:MAG: PAS domain-containing protein [Beijerinckiaceae bacterium]